MHYHCTQREHYVVVEFQLIPALNSIIEVRINLPPLFRYDHLCLMPMKF